MILNTVNLQFIFRADKPISLYILKRNVQDFTAYTRTESKKRKMINDVKMNDNYMMLVYSSKFNKWK